MYHQFIVKSSILYEAPRFQNKLTLGNQSMTSLTLLQTNSFKPINSVRTLKPGPSGISTVHDPCLSIGNTSFWKIVFLGLEESHSMVIKCYNCKIRLSKFRLLRRQSCFFLITGKLLN